MDAKNWLLRNHKLENLMRSKQAQIDKIKELAECLKSISSDELNDDQSHIENLAKKFFEARVEIRESISQLNDLDHQFVLEERYLLNKTPQQIADDFKCSKRHIERLHRGALSALTEVLQKKQK
ncbi:MAG: DUF1492 domain-containing protein [Firmicutes bacterium]|nr:DUF1492 domain-containing protein [Bacillota bacterium]